jgi:hypothetical protein
MVGSKKTQEKVYRFPKHNRIVNEKPARVIIVSLIKINQGASMTFKLVKKEISDIVPPSSNTVSNAGVTSPTE